MIAVQLSANSFKLAFGNLACVSKFSYAALKTLLLKIEASTDHPDNYVEDWRHRFNIASEYDLKSFYTNFIKSDACDLESLRERVLNVLADKVIEDKTFGAYYLKSDYDLGYPPSDCVTYYNVNDLISSFEEILVENTSYLSSAVELIMKAMNGNAELLTNGNVIVFTNQPFTEMRL